MNCKDCDATLTASDRFCPACGTPNALTKFHPKFGPALKIVEPRIITEPAEAGSPSCPRCHRSIAHDQEYCRGCGMELEAAWKQMQRVEVLDSWREEMKLRPYRRPGLLGAGLHASLSVALVAALFVGLGNLWLYARSRGGIEHGLSTDEVLRLLDALSLVTAVAMVASYTLFVGWTWRSYRNLPALAVADRRFSQAWVITGWLVPVVNLLRPKQVLDDLWRGSHPLAPPFSSSWRAGPTSEWTSAWWAGLLLGVPILVSARLAAPEPRGAATPDLAPSLAPSLALAGLGGVILFASCLCLRLVVQRISERQETRAVFVLGADDEVDDLPPLEQMTIARHEPATEPVLVVQPESRDAVYGRY